MSIVWLTFIGSLVAITILLVLAIIALWIAVRIMLTAEVSAGWSDFFHRLRTFRWESFLPNRLEPATDLDDVRRTLAHPAEVFSGEEDFTQALAAEQIHALEEAGYVIARVAVAA